MCFLWVLCVPVMDRGPKLPIVCITKGFPDPTAEQAVLMIHTKESEAPNHTPKIKGKTQGKFK